MSRDDYICVTILSTFFFEISLDIFDPQVASVYFSQTKIKKKTSLAGNDLFLIEQAFLVGM
jgi:hypothetical protein